MVEYNLSEAEIHSVYLYSLNKIFFEGMEEQLVHLSNANQDYILLNKKYLFGYCVKAGEGNGFMFRYIDNCRGEARVWSLDSIEEVFIVGVGDQIKYYADESIY